MQYAAGKSVAGEEGVGASPAFYLTPRLNRKLTVFPVRVSTYLRGLLYVFHSWRTLVFVETMTIACSRPLYTRTVLPMAFLGNATEYLR